VKKYFFSILVRGLLAFSGLMVFLVSAKLFGSEGRGVISYGSSIFASLGLFFSFNFGRTFLAETHKRETLKQDYLLSYLVLNLYAFILTCIIGLLFWGFSESAQNILDFKILVALAITSVYYVWNINGNSIFAAFLKTPLQETVILVTRFVMLSFLIIFLFFDIKDLSHFVLFYASILSCGVLFEVGFLIYVVRPRFELFSRRELAQTFYKSFLPHLDFLAFNSYPLILVVISGWYLGKSEIGRVNFALQVINLIFLLSTTAHIRVSAYVSDVGIEARLSQFKRLLRATFLLSVGAVIVVYFLLKFLTKTTYFGSFEGASQLFLIVSLSVPGYMLYQFFNPIWLEKRLVKRSAFLNTFFLIVTLAISPFFLKQWGETGMACLFSIFHLFLLISQVILYKWYFKSKAF
jgi:O-antigen/teichoic acid export membrane protein